jgi:signal transduction histidine kinase
MDIRLKGEMDGIDAAGRIRDQFNLPVVYLTAYTDPATLKRAKVMEPFGYVVKPFDTRSLMVSIEIALHRHRSESERIYREKLQAVLETVGAICHELNQPMMAISGHTELLMDTLDQNDPVYSKIAKIKSQVERMGAITQKLMGITRYETKDYVQGERIVDIEKSSFTKVLNLTAKGLRQGVALDTPTGCSPDQPRQVPIVVKTAQGEGAADGCVCDGQDMFWYR